MADNIIGYSNYGIPIIGHRGEPVDRNTLKGYFQKGGRIRHEEMKALITSSVWNNSNHTETQNIQGLLCFSSGSPDASHDLIYDEWHKTTPPFVPHFHHYVKTFNFDVSTFNYYGTNAFPTKNNLAYNQKMFFSSATGSITGKFNNTDFPYGCYNLQQSNVANESVVVATTPEAFYCGDMFGKKPEWWVETRFQTDDHDMVEFAFGLFEAEPDGTYGATGLHNQAAGTGKDKLIFSKPFTDKDFITISASNNATSSGYSGSNEFDSQNSLEYKDDSAIISLGIHWNGEEAKFYYDYVTSGTTPKPMSLLHTVSSSAIPTARKMRLMLYIQGGDTAQDNTYVEYIRGAITEVGMFKEVL
tara:strand:- start:474 stop:1547 length:1074 start_codon:yes stop_codon:yes gene_type:complete